MKLRTIAALCVSGRSIYKHKAGVLAYDQQRDARTFPGGMPVVAHPPCRCWSKFLSHQAKPVDREAEMNLGKWCVAQVIRHGGVLEQPAFSALWAACGLPRPGDLADPFCYTVYVEQKWFGFASRKQTWVLVCGVPPADLAPLPFQLDSGTGGSARKFYKEMYSRTMDGFADWLIENSRRTWHSLPVKNWTCLSPSSGFGAPRPLACQSAGRNAKPLDQSQAFGMPNHSIYGLGTAAPGLVGSPA